MAKRKHNQVIQRKGHQGQMLQRKRYHTSQQRRKTVWKNGKQQSNANGRYDRCPSRRYKRESHNRPPSHPKRSNKHSQITKKTSIRHVPGCNQSLWQGMDRRNHVRDVQKGTKHENMVHHKKTKWKLDSNHPNKVWTNKENQNQRQHKTMRSPLCTPICTTNGRNK